MTDDKGRLRKWLVAGHRFQNKLMRYFGGYWQFQFEEIELENF